jgi:hypothetical protein
MKLLIKKFFNSRKIITIRNQFNFRSIDMLIDKNKNKEVSISDSFLWRTDNNFTTKFKFIDILNLFYNLDKTFVEIIFYTKNGEIIKTLKIENLMKSNELIIDKNFVNGIEDYGYFNIFHHNLNNEDNFIIANRCYLGFSKDKEFFSYVHGNLLSKYKKNLNSNIQSDIIQNSLLRSQEYSIQNNFSEFDKTELFFANPTSNLINFKIYNDTYLLKKNSCMIVELKKKNKKTIIKSNCMFLRPIIFNYNGNFFDVYHG